MYGSCCKLDGVSRREERHNESFKLFRIRKVVGCAELMKVPQVLPRPVDVNMLPSTPTPRAATACVALFM